MTDAIAQALCKTASLLALLENPRQPWKCRLIQESGNPIMHQKKHFQVDLP